MTTVLVLGTGMQGQAAVRDLAHSDSIRQVIAADSNRTSLESLQAGLSSGKLRTVQLDAGDLDQVLPLLQQADAVIALLPSEFGAKLAPLAVSCGTHWIDASYALPEYALLHDSALAADVAMLPECGLDPGIDLVLAAKALTELDEVEDFRSYGAGIPEPEASNNPLRYKISWTFAGVLRGYSRPAVLLVDGAPQAVRADQIFAPQNVHTIDIPGLGRLEAYPNGDAERYVRDFDLRAVRSAGRYSMRWPGHSAFWYKLSQLGFLSEEPAREGGRSPRQYLHDLLAPQLGYASDERDVAIVHLVLIGAIGGQRKQISYSVIDYRDLDTGLLAMQRTVGFTASIAAQMILRGQILGRGLLNPIRDVPPQPFLDELQARGIAVVRQEQDAGG